LTRFTPPVSGAAGDKSRALIQDVPVIAGHNQQPAGIASDPQ
jgi:hypothetical protein